MPRTWLRAFELGAFVVENSEGQRPTAWNGIAAAGETQHMVVIYFAQPKLFTVKVL